MQILHQKELYLRLEHLKYCNSHVYSYPAFEHSLTCDDTPLIYRLDLSSYVVF